MVMLRRPVSTRPRRRSDWRALLRGADPAGQFVLGQREGDAKSVTVGHAELLSQLHELAGDATHAVVGPELDPLAVGVAQTAAQHLDEHEGHSGVTALASRVVTVQPFSMSGSAVAR
jgi:hypothetical protein